MITIVKCLCGEPTCEYYCLSEGIFFSQGNVWSKERAQEIADAINFMDKIRAEYGDKMPEVLADFCQSHDLNEECGLVKWKNLISKRLTTL